MMTGVLSDNQKGVTVLSQCKTRLERLADISSLRICVSLISAISLANQVHEVVWLGGTGWDWFGLEYEQRHS